MKQALAIDIGTGTQDIFLLRIGLSPENGFKLVMPSPTMRIRHEIQEATRLGQTLLLTGVTMGGGPCHWAATAHLEAGFPLYATPPAAQTFNDDLEWVEREMGVKIISEDEVATLTTDQRIELRDLDLDAIYSAFTSFGVMLEPDVLAVAVFDHGAAPPDVSDRTFRFELIARQISASKHLSSFSFAADDIPPEFTRMRSVQTSARSLSCPQIFMDTAPAAVLGATLDPYVASQTHKLITNIGNYHTLAFRLGPRGIEGVFEHHTGLLDRSSLEHLLRELAAGTLSGEKVFAENGHGALILTNEPIELDAQTSGVIVTGPRRGMMRSSRLQPYFAVPLGDMMLSGCFGLLLAAAEHLPTNREVILDSLVGTREESTPWELDL